MYLFNIYNLRVHFQSFLAHLSLFNLVYCDLVYITHLKVVQILISETSPDNQLPSTLFPSPSACSHPHCFLGDLQLTLSVDSH